MSEKGIDALEAVGTDLETARHETLIWLGLAVAHLLRRTYGDPTARRLATAWLAAGGLWVLYIVWCLRFGKW